MSHPIPNPLRSQRGNQRRREAHSALSESHCDDVQVSKETWIKPQRLTTAQGFSAYWSSVRFQEKHIYVLRWNLCVHFFGSVATINPFTAITLEQDKARISLQFPRRGWRWLSDPCVCVVPARNWSFSGTQKSIWTTQMEAAWGTSQRSCSPPHAAPSIPSFSCRTAFDMS